MKEDIKYDPHFLKEWRKYAGLTQEEVAEALGLTGAHVSRVETGMRDWDRKYLQRFKLLVNDALDRQHVKGLRIRHVSELLSCPPDPYTLIAQSPIVQHQWEQVLASMAELLGAPEGHKVYLTGRPDEPSE